jgi:hypothetical protein
MEPDDWAYWQRTNPLVHGFAPRPCSDCPADFAAEMRALGKCNGTPGWRPPADDIEEAEVGDTVTVSNVQVSAPCGSCAHQEVCSIRRTLGGLEEVDVAMPKPDPALTVVLGLTVECSHYLRNGAGSVKGRKLNLTSEERERRAAQGRANLAARRAAGA